ncbi:MAG: hypothetical protein AAB728_06210 [Patescibacteria group bacterium]
MKTSYLLRLWLVTTLTAGAFLPQSVAHTGIPARETLAGSAIAARREAAKPTVKNAIVTLETPEPATATVTTKDGGIHPLHARAIAEVESLLPAVCASRPRNVFVRYDKPEKRGLGGKTSVIVSGNLPLPEFRAVLVHEMLGHVNDLGCLEGTPKSGASAFRDGNEVIFNDDPSVVFYSISWASATERKKGGRDEDFVSGYARADAFEDAAETIAFTVLHREEFKRRAQGNPVLSQKLAWVETYALPSAQSYALSTYVWDPREIPWDITMLPYVWIGPAKAVAKNF